MSDTIDISVNGCKNQANKTDTKDLILFEVNGKRTEVSVEDGLDVCVQILMQVRMLNVSSTG